MCIYIYICIYIYHLFAIRGRKKEALKRFKHAIKICPKRGNIFQNKVGNMWTAILKISAVLRT